ncbi:MULTISPECIES: GNAT family N-acetyltransferase [unclassified Paracoccus (in: a-proteobacteria)]|uniref:GNAT family N-acetyltransferase n=1 Tax=unclassified Paracoccus (in: a-proteobacteria) TaxID=2688777 RepID=UPI002E10CA5C|nr:MULTISPECIES: GNAT family N-acetyltransferase [unclassified Paracoccus (in: a-proteobacteria)]
MADHFEADEPGCDFHLIAREDLAVGFFKIDRDYPARFDFARPGELGLRGVMIDRNSQGQGIGKAAMTALGPYVARL